MTDSNTTSPTLKTLTEPELFQRYLDSDVRHGTSSSLVKGESPSLGLTAGERFMYECVNHEAGEEGSELAEFLLDRLRVSDAPLNDMTEYLSKLSRLSFALQVMMNDYWALLRATNDEEEGLFGGWDDDTRFQLPVTERNEVA